MSKQLIEMEIALWQSRMQTIQMSARALNAEGQLLNTQAKECQDNLARLDAALKAAIPDGDVGIAPAGGGGPGEEH